MAVRQRSGDKVLSVLHRDAVVTGGFGVTGPRLCTTSALWAQVRKTVADILSPPDELILFCGMSIGHEDVAVGYTRTGRAPLDETVTVIQD